MEIYISINGVLRNFIQKFDCQYRSAFIDNEPEEEAESFEYDISPTVQNDDLLKYYVFQSKEEYENFCFIEYPLEIFGHVLI